MKFVLDCYSLESQGITAAGASQEGVEGHRMHTTHTDDRNGVHLFNYDVGTENKKEVVIF